MANEEKFKLLEEHLAAAKIGGGQDRIEEQHKKNKWTARERLAALLDRDTFQEIDKFVYHTAMDFGLDKKRFPGDGVVTGYGTMDGRQVFVFAQDFTVWVDR
jgi:acetyl-CoA carboxylase carboxyltransferase component